MSVNTRVSRVDLACVLEGGGYHVHMFAPAHPAESVDHTPVTTIVVASSSCLSLVDSGEVARAICAARAARAATPEAVARRADMAARIQRMQELRCPALSTWGAIPRNIWTNLAGDDSAAFMHRVHDAAHAAGERGEISPIRWIKFARSL
jgi:hypothetical protein